MFSLTLFLFLNLTFFVQFVSTENKNLYSLCFETELKDRLVRTKIQQAFDQTKLTIGKTKLNENAFQVLFLSVSSIFNTDMIQIKTCLI